MDEIARQIEPLVPRLRRFAWALARDDEEADDLVQDCLERAISRWHLRRRDGDLRAWLFVILRNLFVSSRRQRARRGWHVGVDDPGVELIADETQTARLGLRDALSGIDALPEDQRVVLLLVCVEDMSYEEVAQVLALPLGTVMSRLSRARERLRLHLEQERPTGLRRVK